MKGDECKWRQVVKFFDDAVSQRNNFERNFSLKAFHIYQAAFLLNIIEKLYNAST